MVGILIQSNREGSDPITRPRDVRRPSDSAAVLAVIGRAGMCVTAAHIPVVFI